MITINTNNGVYNEMKKKKHANWGVFFLLEK